MLPLSLLCCMQYIYVAFTTEILSDNYHLEFLKTTVDVGGALPFVRYFYYTTLFDTAVPVVKKTSLFCISYGLKCANMWHYSTVPSRSEILLMYKLHSMIFTMHWSCKTILKGTFVCSNFSTLGGSFRPPCYIFWVTSQIL